MAISLGGIGGAAGIFVLIMVVAFWLMKQRSEHRAEYGTREERKLEQEEDLGAIARAIKGLEKRAEEEKKEEEGIGKGVKQAAKEEEGKSGKDIGKAAEENVGAVEGEKKVEKETEAGVGRELGMVASVKVVLDSVSNYIARVKPSMRREEQDVQVIEKLMKSLNNTSNFSAIDKRVNEYLKKLFARIGGAIKRSVEEDHEKEVLHGKLVKQLKDAAKVARGVIKGARKAFQMLQKAKKKERKNFKKEIKDISKSLKDKKKELSKIQKSKQANRIAIAQLKREIILLRQQLGFVIQLNNQLKNTYKTMDRELKEMKRLLKMVSKTEKQVGKHEKNADKREKKIEKRYKSLNKLAGELEKSIEGLTNPHDLAIKFSGKLKEFYGKYREILNGDLVFDDEVRKILLLNITITMQMETHERLSISLEQAEKAIDQGLGAATEVISAIVGGQDQRANLKNLVGEIKKAGGEIDYETKVEMFMQKLTIRMEQAERNVNAQITELENEDKRLIEEIDRANEENSNHIGRTMATMVNRKTQIDTRYMGEAKKFEKQLQSKNQIASKTYRQARRLKARRAPAPRPVAPS